MVNRDRKLEPPQLIAAAKEDLRARITAERRPRLPILLRRLAALSSDRRTLAGLCAHWGPGDGFASGPDLILDLLLNENPPNLTEAGRCIELAWRSRTAPVADWVAAPWFRRAQDHGLDVRSLAWEWLATHTPRRESYASPSRDAVSYLRSLTLTAEEHSRLAAIEAKLPTRPGVQ